MNDLQEKFGAKGLSVIGVTGDNEDKAKTAKWVSAKKVKYAYAYDKGNQLSNHFNVKGIPHAVLVSPLGKVVWSGFPASLTEKTIQGALAGALKAPIFDTPSYAQALASAKKLPAKDNGPAMVEAILHNITARVASMKELLAAGDLLKAQTLATDLNSSLAGLPEHADAAKVLAEIKADPSSAKLIGGFKAVDGIDVEGLKKRKDADKAQAELERIMKDLPDSLPARRAKEKLDRLAQIKPGLK